MCNYKINFTANTITISKEFEQTASKNPKSEEYKLLAKLQKDYPNMSIVRKTHRSAKRANPCKGLTYANMERYINAYDNAAELLETFEQVKEIATAQTNSYLFVKSWFMKQFPNYKNVPDFTTLSLITEIIAAPIVYDSVA